jgi:hypothetical protein
MRDNHTFKQLSDDVEVAKIQIKQQFDRGYTCGMLCTTDVPIKPVHAQGRNNLTRFLDNVEEFYRNMVEVSKGAGI